MRELEKLVINVIVIDIVVNTMRWFSDECD